MIVSASLISASFRTCGLLPIGATRRVVLAAALLLAIPACTGQNTHTGGERRLPTPRMGAAVISLTGRIYVIGGVTGSGYVSSVSACDPVTWLCSERAQLPTGTAGASAVEMGGLLYVTGGRDSQGVLDRLIVYRPSADEWAPKRSMPSPRWNHMSAALGGRVYVFGGVVGTGSARRVLADVLAYAPDRDQWEHVGTMPEAVQSAAVAMIDGKVYLIGGRTETYATVTTNSAASTAVHEFDPETESWRARRPMPTPRTGAAAAVRDGKILVVGGARADQAVGVVEIYDPATDSWTTGTPLQTSRTGHGAVSVEGRIYIIAGASVSDPLRLVGEIEELPR